MVTNESHAAPLTKETDVSGLKMMDMPTMPDMPDMPTGNFRYVQVHIHKKMMAPFSKILMIDQCD